MKVFASLCLLQLAFLCVPADIELVKKTLVKTLKQNLKLKQVSKCDEQSLFLIEKTISEDDLQTLFNKLFVKLKQVAGGYDPFNYESFSFGQDGYGLLVKASMEKMVLSGLSSMNRTHLLVNNTEVFHLETNLNFKEIQVTGNYDFIFDLLTMLPLFGKGVFGIWFPSVDLELSLDMEATKDKILQIKDIDLDMKTPKFLLDLQNLFGIESYSKLINSVINDVSTDLAGTLTPLIKSAVVLTKPQLNSLLCNYGVTFDKMIFAIQQFVK